MSENRDVPSGTPRGLEHLILPPKLGPRALLEWMEQARHFFYVAGIILGTDSAAVNAKLKRPHAITDHVPVIGGMSMAYRAGKVSKPIAQAGGACVAAVQYLQSAADQFKSAYIPELEAAKYRPKPSDFDWMNG